MAEKEEAAGDLSAEEQAYFEAGGEAELPEAETAEEGAETEQEQTAETADQADDNGGDKAETKEKASTVPHQALHAEREKHKETRSELNDMREKWARLEERMRALQTAAKPEKEEDAPPDPNDDIFAALQYEQRKRQELEAQFNETREQAQQRQQAQQHQQQAFQHLNQSLNAVRAELPDVDEASNWLYDVRKSQLKAAGMDDFSADQHIQQEVYGGIINALQNGRDPARYFYEYAKASGYVQKPSGDQGKGAAEKVAKIAKAQDASKTLGQTSGKAGGDEITGETLAGMSDSEFSAWISKPENERKFAQIMGA